MGFNLDVSLLVGCCVWYSTDFKTERALIWFMISYAFFTAFTLEPTFARAAEYPY